MPATKPQARLLPSGTLYAITHEGRAITCLRCGSTSWHPKDKAERYCGFCCVFHQEPVEVAEGKLAEALARLQAMPGALIELACVACQHAYLATALPFPCRCGHSITVEDYQS